jgi:hypothetical protein
MRRRIVLVTFCMVAALSLAAGCGNGGGGVGGGEALSHDQYQALLDELRADLEAQEEAFGSFDATDPESLIEGATLAATASRRVADRLSAVTPPADAAEAHPKLVAGFSKLAELLEQFAAAAQANDLQKIQEIGQQFSSSPPPEIEALNDGLAQLRDAGYDLPQE